VARARTTVKGGAVRVDGLAESMRALNKFSPALRKEAVNIFRAEAITVQAKAKANAQAHPASSRRTGWIGRSATNLGAGIKLNPNAKGGGSRAYATEFGMDSWQYRNWQDKMKGTVQKAMKSRTFYPFVGVSKGLGPGYVIQPAIRAHLPGMSERVTKRLHALLNRELDKAGVPH